MYEHVALEHVWSLFNFLLIFLDSVCQYCWLLVLPHAHDTKVAMFIALCCLKNTIKVSDGTVRSTELLRVL